VNYVRVKDLPDDLYDAFKEKIDGIFDLFEIKDTRDYMICMNVLISFLCDTILCHFPEPEDEFQEKMEMAREMFDSRLKKFRNE
jgi:hypothetical protein